MTTILFVRACYLPVYRLYRAFLRGAPNDLQLCRSEDKEEHRGGDRPARRSVRQAISFSEALGRRGRTS